MKLFTSYEFVSIKILTIFFLMVLTTASVSARDDVPGFKITSPITGVIKTVHIKEQQQVKKGDLLLEYDDTLLNSNLSEAQANMNAAKLNFSEARKEVERAEELYERTVLSEHDLQTAKIAYAKAIAQKAQIENQLVHAQWNQSHSKLYAPFSGMIVRLFSYSGQYVNNEVQAETLLILQSSE